MGSLHAFSFGSKLAMAEEGCECCESGFCAGEVSGEVTAAEQALESRHWQATGEGSGRCL